MYGTQKNIGQLFTQLKNALVVKFAFHLVIIQDATLVNFV